jgi:hypothetical protein
MKFQKLLLPILFLLISVTASGQDDDIFGIAKKPKVPKSESSLGNATRNLIEMFSMEFSGGSGFHQIKMPFYSTAPTLYPLYQVSDLDNLLVLEEENPLNLKGNKYAFPISAGFRINFFNILTAGLTYGQEYGKIGPLKGNNQIFLFDETAYKATKLYFSGGLIVWDAMNRARFLNWQYRNFSSSNRYMQSELRQRVRQHYPWRVVLEGDFGFFFIRQTFDTRVEVSEKPFVGYGIRLERDFSEYTKFFVKGSMEKREFTFSASDFSEAQNFGQNYFGVQMGFAFVLPGTQRCPIKSCGVVMKHSHNGIEYRGSNIFTFQNRKIGQWR